MLTNDIVSFEQLGPGVNSSYLDPFLKGSMKALIEPHGWAR